MENLMNQPVLVTYATRFGSTEEVAAAIAATLRDGGHPADLQPMESVRGLDEYAAVVMGSAVNYAYWLQPAFTFLRRHEEALQRLPVAAFSVHIQNISDDAQSRAARLAYLDEVRPFVQPLAEGYFAGRFNRHGAVVLLPGWIGRFVPTIDLRKWEQIRAWAAGLPAVLFPPEQQGVEHVTISHSPG
jgi:menaquinone-dependent protoporphyrinogen oxidase